MGKVLLIQLCLLLIYISYKGIFCDESPSSYQQDTPSNSYAKLSLRDVVNMLEADRKDDFRYFIKRKGNNNLEDGLVFEQLLDPVYESESNAEEILKNNPMLMQFLAEKLKSPPQTRFLSPRLGRTADPAHHLPSLPPRFGKRNTVFTPRMG
uniref:CSON010790 protein n=1 Tax=Culicoides sonorensis TaxID=179676 RepID=A0A336M4Y8_CULSO